MSGGIKFSSKTGVALNPCSQLLFPLSLCYLTFMPYEREATESPYFSSQDLWGHFSQFPLTPDTAPHEPLASIQPGFVLPLQMVSRSLFQEAFS